MSEDKPPAKPSKPTTGVRKVGRDKRPSRQLSFPTRVRDSVRRAGDRALSADAVWSVTFVLVVVALLGNQRCGMSYGAFEVGDRAPADIRVKYDLHLPDEAETLARRQAARAAVPEVYAHDTRRGERLARELEALFIEGRRALEGPAGEAVESGSPAPERLGAGLEPGTVEVLARHGFDESLQTKLGEILRREMQGPVIGNKALLEREAQVTVARVPNGREELLSQYDGIVELDEARERVRAAVLDELTLPREDRAVLAELAASFVDANLALDPEGTRTRREAAAAAVPPVLEKVARGTAIVREGEPITADILSRLEAARLASTGRLGLLEVGGLLFIVSLLAFFLYRYALFHQRGFRKLRHLHALLVLIQLSVLLLAQAILWLAGEVVENVGAPFNEVLSYNYLVPVGAGSIMIALLANGRIAMVNSTFVALLLGALNDWDAFLMTWSLLVQWAGIYAISAYRERAALIRAGLVVGGAGAVTALALEALQRGGEPMSGTLYAAGLAFIGGAVGVGLLISFTLPLLEGLFHVLTDVRLLELSNLNNPLLSELAVKAPGSYNHSLVVGTLAEEGAKAIGANSLFCRVAAFYHDIGKLLKPEYYVENQRGSNPHDRLSPSMSALVVAAHVKDGIRLAREAGLPEQIVDIIPQHHGTRLMTYFYEKAKKSADPTLGPIKQEDFRYPGPKPQTREAAIFMLADGVEAAARSVDEPTANRMREVIRQVSNAIVLDGQFQECDLTFADLDKIQQAFLRTLVSMYHHRVDYPGFDFGNVKSTESEPTAAPAERKVARGS